jgi:MFS transporter, Spinster family, sphingosine-1-phosphate transporter
MSSVTSNVSKNKTLVIPTRRQSSFAFTILFTINLLNYADRYVLPAVLPKIGRDFQLTQFQAGLLGSSFLFVYALAALPIGIWADQGRRKNIVALCVGIWSLVTALASITRNFIQLFCTRIILGIGEAGYGPATVSLLGDFFPKSHRGRILSYWSSSSLIGPAIGFILGGLIADTLGWRWAFCIVGIPGLITAGLAWKMLEPLRGVFDRKGDSTSETEALYEDNATSKDLLSIVKKLLRIPTYRTLVCALTFSLFTVGGTSYWLPSYLVDTFGLTLSEAGVIGGGVLVSSGLIGTIIGGWLADYAQSRMLEGRLLVASIGILIGAPLVLLALLIHNLLLFTVVFVIAGISLNICTGPFNAVIQDIIPPTLRATAIGLALLIAHLLGDATSPSVIGIIADAHMHSLSFALLVTAPTFLCLAGLTGLSGLRTVARDMRRVE